MSAGTVSAPAASAASARPCRILCVDDNDLDFERVQRLASKLEVPVELARAIDGAEAVEYLEARTRPPGGPQSGLLLPDLLLLDLNMPRLDGHGCLAAIRGMREWDDVLVVVVSTSMRAQDIDGTRSGGATGYLVKPLSLDALRAVVALRGAKGFERPPDTP